MRRTNSQHAAGFPPLRRKPSGLRLDTSAPRRLPALREGSACSLPSLFPAPLPPTATGCGSPEPAVVDHPRHASFAEAAPHSASSHPPQMMQPSLSSDISCPTHSLVILPATDLPFDDDGLSEPGSPSPMSPTVTFTPATPQITPKPHPVVKNPTAPTGRARAGSVMTRRNSPAPDLSGLCDGDVAALRAAQTGVRQRHKPKAINPQYLFPEWILR